MFSERDPFEIYADAISVLKGETSYESQPDGHISNHYVALSALKKLAAGSQGTNIPTVRKYVPTIQLTVK